MAHEGERSDYCGAAAGTTGVFFWFAGWLFTIACADLIWWKIILGLVGWPYYLGQAVM